MLRLGLTVEVTGTVGDAVTVAVKSSTLASHCPVPSLHSAI